LRCEGGADQSGRVSLKPIECRVLPKGEKGGKRPKERGPTAGIKILLGCKQSCIGALTASLIKQRGVWGAAVNAEAAHERDLTKKKGGKGNFEQEGGGIMCSKR